MLMQELMIQQLQDELRRVRRHHHGNSDRNDPTDSAAFIGDDVDQLREQLHTAIRRVAQLTKDKEVLIELGNRLRAQLIHHGQYHRGQCVIILLLDHIALYCSYSLYG